MRARARAKLNLDAVDAGPLASPFDGADLRTTLRRLLEILLDDRA